VEFLMDSLVLFRDLPTNYIRCIDIKIERVAASDEVVVPTSKDCGMSFLRFGKTCKFAESDGEVEDLVVGHVQTSLEFAYPNALTLDTIVE
jgi:hypothetical protein